MRHHEYLMIPGPTPVPRTVALAGAVPMINHRGPEFGELFKEVTRALQEILKTDNTVLIFRHPAPELWKLQPSTLLHLLRECW